MNLKIALAGVVAVALVAVPVSALTDSTLVDTMPWETVQCEDHTAEEIALNGGVLVHTFVDPLHPDETVTVHLLCEAPASGDVGAETDCTATSYSLTGWKWSSAYSGRIDTSNSYGFSSSQVVSTFTTSAEEWDKNTPADIFSSFSTGGKGKDAGRRDGWNQHGWKNLGGGGTIAVTYTWSSGGNAVESDAGYNTFYGWSLTGESNKMDLQNIATHELGHTFGLGHSSSASVNSCLTMYPTGSYGETQKRTLGDGDILGIKALYG